MVLLKRSKDECKLNTLSVPSRKLGTLVPSSSLVSYDISVDLSAGTLVTPRYKIDIAALKECSADIQLLRFIILNKLWLCIVRLTFNVVFGITMKFALPLVFLFIATLSIDAMAQGTGVSASNMQKNNQQQLKVKSSKDAAKLAKSRFGGKVLKVENKKSGYRVKLIKTDGHIISIYVDAKTGKINGG